MGTLILIRHGESTWNHEDRFTGWVDVPLTPLGEKEALWAGVALGDAGFQVDRAFTSTLRRAIETCRLVLDELGQHDLEQIQAWELNERFYGTLTGLNKTQTAKEFGPEQVHLWRRGYEVRPPGGESLKDTSERVLPYFQRHILSTARKPQTVLVSAHGNSIRAMVKELDGLSDTEIPEVEIGTAEPLIYKISKSGAVVSKDTLHRS